MFRQLKNPFQAARGAGHPMLALTLVVHPRPRHVQNAEGRGHRYNELAVSQALTSDVNPPSRTSSDAFATVLEITDTTLAVDFAQDRPLMELEQQFETRHKYWVSTLARRRVGDRIERHGLPSRPRVFSGSCAVRSFPRSSRRPVTRRSALHRPPSPGL